MFLITLTINKLLEKKIHKSIYKQTSLTRTSFIIGDLEGVFFVFQIVLRSTPSAILLLLGVFLLGVSCLISAGCLGNTPGDMTDTRMGVMGVPTFLATLIGSCGVLEEDFVTLWTCTLWGVCCIVFAGLRTRCGVDFGVDWSV
jgi:hypothetical protein